jgi:hypothetical protein
VALAVALAAVSFESLATPITGLVADAISSNALAGTRVTLFTATNSARLLDWMPANTPHLCFRAKQEE